MNQLDWSLSPDSQKCFLYSCQFSPTNKYILAGGAIPSSTVADSSGNLLKADKAASATGEAKLFEITIDRCVAIISVPGVVTSTVFSHSEKTVMVAGGKTVYFLDIDESGDKEFLY